MAIQKKETKEETLDPQNWDEIRAIGHLMIDDMMDYLKNQSQMPVWKQPSRAVKETFKTPLPQTGQHLSEIYTDFTNTILPYNRGNIHPRFFGWVQGSGTATGMLADMLAAGMNPNTGMGDHAAMYVEQQVIEWCKEMFNFPTEASGLLVSGATMANVIALAVARNAVSGLEVRAKGVDTSMTMYCSAETHICVVKGAELLGIGTERVRQIPVDTDFKINIAALRQQINLDISHGMKPFCIIANVGTVNTGATDDLKAIYALCQEYQLWFHVDGAFGSLAKLTPSRAKEMELIEKADSLSFDFHKWMHVPYESACVLIRNKTLHREAFQNIPDYLTAHERGLAAGPETVSNYGIELSRGFKALKIWMMLKEHGIQKFIRLIEQNINQAQYLETLINNHSDLEMLTPVALNIVCFRFKHATKDLNVLNKEILMQLHESGVAAPTYTILNGQYAIRACITNHRTIQADLELMVNKIVEIGRAV
jgi:aromatic-L-amino-acid/L-tryptophan decarboxylase